jgi:hypothetical protein
MEELHLQALILHGKASDAEPALLLGAADEVPSEEALSARHPIGSSPEEGRTNFVESIKEPDGEFHGAHGVSRERIQHDI